MTLDRLKQQWEDLAEMDPFWAIITDPARQFGKWDVDEFFETGKHEARDLMETASKLPPLREAGKKFGRARLLPSHVAASTRFRTARREPRPPKTTQLEFFHKLPGVWR
jgi:hypothetical protein